MHPSQFLLNVADVDNNDAGWLAGCRLVSIFSIVMEVSSCKQQEVQITIFYCTNQLSIQMNLKDEINFWIIYLSMLH
ncbi:hypothetical protein ACH3XW_15205 [Acanthocheilonema viteae]